MYAAIRSHPTVLKIYGEKLVEQSVVSEAQCAKIADDYRERLDRGDSANDKALGMIGNQYTVDWTKYRDALLEDTVDTGVTAEEVQRLAAIANGLPKDFKLNARVERIVEDRKRMAKAELPIDWGFAENLAYASLLTQEFNVRLIGQDSRRGTFFHRHVAFHDAKTGEVVVPLDKVTDRPRAFTVADSLLSEEAVLAFEYGYSTTSPDCLVIWEAQFGDFANGAQVVIDQFISSGEAKWDRFSGLTLFLPHGYEGQGPEHSSARLERFLQLCAEHNMQVCVPSTPAQMFHLIRRQMLRSLRKPLVVMMPKSLLRHPSSTSPINELSHGRFKTLINEVEPLDRKSITRLVFCSGKVYFDLSEARKKHKLFNVAIIRIEELYPFPAEEYGNTIYQYPNANEIIWCQEEPQNQGAWYQIRHRLVEPLSERHDLYYAGRPGAAAPASGIYALHARQQEAFVSAALAAPGQEN
jgi:2-oxoglutarate dehydrogenase E1 component